MGSVNRVYLARLSRMSVLGPLGESFGRVRDVVISISIVRQQPRVLGLVVDLATRRKIFIPILRVAAIEPHAVTLSTGNVSLHRFEQRPGEALALGQVLDTLVKVNDPALPELAGVDVVVTDLGVEQTRSRDWCEDRSPVELLRGALRTYAWGSRTAIAEFTGRPVPAAHPEAELWFGAHPGDPAWLQTPHGQTSLLEALVADPEGQLGSASRARFGDVLPFLVKVLAADEPLSLQAHPSAEQAVEGYLREERMGIPVSSPVRNYRDTSHKPELLVALQPFEALAGFREAARTTELLRALAVSDLDPFIDLLSEGSDADGLRALFTTWITAPQPDIDVLVPAVLDGAIQYVSSGATEFGAEAKTVLELGERYPGDAGVLAALLLNRISLAPGEAIFLPAGNLHAYVRGFGVEVMANSDNVLRGGLTPKHVDVPELLRVLDFAPTPKARLRPPIRREGLGLVFETPTDEFAATLLVLDGDHLGHEVDASSGHDGPQILLCTEGSATVHGKCGSLTLQRGTAAWVAADDGPIRLTAGQPAKLFRATVGL